MSDNNKPKSSLSPKVLALVLAGASAMTITAQFLPEKEGNELRAYRDAGGVWTICGGLTQGVKPGDVETPEGCARRNRAAYGKYYDELDRLVKVPLSEPARAGVMSFCTYNIGSHKCRNSTFLELLNEGNKTAACRQILRWIFDGGKDCRIKSNNCAGQVIRRQQEYELCMS